VPIAEADLEWRLSVAAAAGDTDPSTPAASLGDQVSTTVITTAQLGNLFDTVTGAESSAGVVDYRCLFVLNNHATLTLLGATVSITGQTAGGASIDIALDDIAACAKGAATAQAALIASETTAPTGVGAFGTTDLAVGDLDAGEVRAVWLRRTVPAGTSALNLDSVTLRVAGDTAA